MKTLGLNTYLEGWWEKDRLRKTSLRFYCIKKIFPGATEPKVSELKIQLHIFKCKTFL